MTWELSRLAPHLTLGEDVVFLCEGDPFFYGTFMYLFDRLAGDFETEVIPGVTSVVACACRLKQPLVSRNDVLTVLAGPMSDEELEAPSQTWWLLRNHEGRQAFASS